MINAIFASDLYGGIGYNGTLPWPHNRADMKHFQELTSGNIIVMGRKSWDDPKMPKPLPNRITYVATNRPVDHALSISGDLPEKILGLESHYPNRKIWVIGGANLITQCSSIIDQIHLTYVSGTYKIDTRIKLGALLNSFTPITARHDPEYHCTFVTYESVFNRKK